MKKPFNYSCIFIFICLCNFYCGGKNIKDANGTSIDKPPHEEKNSLSDGSKLNLIVLIDQSDRLLTSNQVTRDTELFSVILKAFEQRQRAHIFKPGDEMNIFLAQQKTTNNASNINLEIDKKLGATTWYAQVGRTKEKLKSAYVNALNNRFDGADIWAFFKDGQNMICKPNMVNKIIIITDGYHYFSKATTQKRPKGTYLKPGDLNSLRSANSVCSTNNTMRPVGNYPDCEVLMLEINPKNVIEEPYEIDAIKSWWTAWFQQMNIKASFETNNPQYDYQRNNKIQAFIL